jgi:hypothetical protein
MMKLMTLTLIFSLTILSNYAFGQEKSLIDAPADTSSLTTTGLTPQIFFNMMAAWGDPILSAADYHEKSTIPLFDKRFTQHVLFFGRSVIANKTELEFSYSFSPLTVTDFNRQARLQLYMPETPRHERRSLPFISRL